MSVRRSIKNMVHNFTASERAVREATSNDAWAASSTLLAKIAAYTYDLHECPIVLGMLWRRMDDHIPKNWRHVYKSLVLCDYLLKMGSDQAVGLIRSNVYAIQTLRDFQYTDAANKDQGVNVRERARAILSLLNDEQSLQEQRARAHMAHSRINAVESPRSQRNRSHKLPQHPLNVDAMSADDAVIQHQRAIHAQVLGQRAQQQQHAPASTNSTGNHEDDELRRAIEQSQEEEAIRQSLRDLEEQQLAKALQDSSSGGGTRTGAWGHEEDMDPPQAQFAPRSPNIQRVVVQPTERWSPPKGSPPRSNPRASVDAWCPPSQSPANNNPFFAPDAPAYNPYTQPE